MVRRRTWLLVSLLVFAFALPLAAHEPPVTLVIIDAAKNRAYIPDGTVLPEGMVVRAAQTRMPLYTTPVELRRGERSFALKVREDVLNKRPPLVFEYAPADKFVQTRERYEQLKAARAAAGPKAQSHYGCGSDTYFDVQNTGYYGDTYYSWFSINQCTAWQGYMSAWFTYRTSAAAEDDGYVYVYDDAGGFACDDNYPGYRERSCESESYRAYNASSTNKIHHGGTTYHIEWLQNYEPWYVAFWLDVEYTVPHY